METVAPHRKIWQSWGQRLRDLRGSTTQAELAAALGVAQTTVSRWERGELAVDDEVKVRLAAYYGVTLDHLFPWPEVVG